MAIRPLTASARAPPRGAGRRVFAGGCATSSAYRAGQRAETAQDYDRAVVDYTKAVRENPGDRTAQLALDRARVRAVAGTLLTADRPPRRRPNTTKRRSSNSRSPPS